MPQASAGNEIAFSTFYTQGAAGKYRSITMSGQDVEGTYKSAIKGANGVLIDQFKTVAPPMQDLARSILGWQQKGQLEEFKAVNPNESNFMSMLVFWGPLLGFVVLWFVFMRQAQMGGNKALSFGKVRARGLDTSSRRATFAEVAGCNEAALYAARTNKKWVEMIDFEQAKDKVYMGSERKSMVMTDEDKRDTAYHEAGHAVVAASIPGADPVHKVTIIPRGRALGVTWQLPERDRYSATREHMEGEIAILMGGRVAEEIFFGRISTGASNDIERATQIARRMVCDYGMSEKLGPLSYGQGEHEIFLGKDFSELREFSESTAQIIDAEVHEIVMRNYLQARTLILEKQEILDRLAKALLERETLDAQGVAGIMGGMTAS
jgi:ATP-dependent Zn protease